jgi:hypothetical protein
MEAFMSTNTIPIATLQLPRLNKPLITFARAVHDHLAGDQQTWTRAPETMQGSRVIAGLTSAKTYYFRFRALTRAGETGFSQV